MQNRTFCRKMLDIIFNNAFMKAIVSLVNFCNELRYYNRKELKFFRKMPLNNIQDEYYKNKFVFNSVTSHYRTGSK